MQSINKFDVNVYSEEGYGFTEEEYNEVMAASAVEDEKFEGYGEWSESLEQAQFDAELEQRATVQTANGPMLIKRECDHKACGFTCARDTKIGGISI
jgi:hypothetical protein